MVYRGFKQREIKRIEYTRITLKFLFLGCAMLQKILTWLQFPNSRNFLNWSCCIGYEEYHSSEIFKEKEFPAKKEFCGFAGLNW